MYYLQEYDRKQLLIKLAGKYEDMRYFNEDPVIFPRQYTKIQDIEISGFISAYLAFGNRKQIVKKCKVIDDMFEGKPYEWLMNRKYEKFKDNNDVFYRFVKYEDLHRIFGILFETYDCYGKLEFFAEHWLHQGKELPYKLQEICSKSKKFVMPTSACKRMCMFLRWMVRKDSPVDIGIWNGVESSELYIPLDVHVGNTARELGLTNRKSNDWKTVVEITDKLKEVFPNDPCKGDFALFGYDFYKGWRYRALSGDISNEESFKQRFL